MDPAAVPRVPVGSGRTPIPVIGLGTWRSPPEEVTTTITCAIEAGYRHFDGSPAYVNETALGAALREQFSAGRVTREDVFIVSKLWNSFHAAEDVKVGLQKTLEDLGLDYLDLYLMHWPYGFQRGDELFPLDKDGNLLYSDVHYLETWKAMEKCVEEGLVKNIGVSNFNSLQFQDIIDNCSIKPAVHQIEVHPYLTQQKLVRFCQDKGVAVTAYSPFASGPVPGAPAEVSNLLGETVLKTLATKYNKSPAQVVLRWLLQRDIIVIPKSVTPSRIKENIQVFDFELTSDDMEAVNGLNKNYRFMGPFTFKEDG
ncbi:hypothetical protein NP493_299g00020 [Ridgeia piscesae]|uniref:NADP-dependent oxidoreductase domain-containing protein n=1 Tax=Ridgeia piscesae TaxID=27915 RepID=A0AAD9L5H0_RIDPI|nr:hypothetical protein NP493_299g00020 [Ridgeia piscesae]